MEPAWTVYILHFDQPVGKALHYVGVTKTGRLHWRQLEHLRGVGARLTANAVAAGIGWSVAARIPCDTPEVEREIKRAGHFDKKCPVCIAKVSCCIAPVGLPHYQPSQQETRFAAIAIETKPNVSRY